MRQSAKMYFFTIAILFSLLSCGEKNGMIVTNIKCEYQVNPMGIDRLQPRLSWQLESNLRNKEQSSYRILVSENPKELNKNKGEIWDSEKIESGQSLLISFGGKMLESGKQYFWKVKVWDEAGNQTEWSDIGSWTMGFLNEKDWNAQWVGSEVKNEIDSATQYAAKQFRKEFLLLKKPVKAIARFCGLGFGELYINGQKVSIDKMAPGWTDYRKKVYYMTYDVTDQLKKGENALGVLLGNSWYNLSTPDLFSYNKAPWKSDPKFLLNITVTYNDGTTTEIVSDESWKSRISHITFNCIRGGESIDAGKIEPGWDKIAFDDTNWNGSEIVIPPSGNLVPQSIPAEQVTEKIKPVKLTEPQPGVYVFDLGMHIAGWIQFKTTGNEGQLVTFDFDENLNSDGTITKKSLSSHTYGRYQQGELILSGKGTDLFEPSFTYHGFRYVQVKGISNKPELEDLIGCKVHNSIATVGSFECSNKLINKIHNAFKFSLENSLHSVQTEPAREKINWTQDAHNTMEGAIFNYNFYSFAIKWLEDVIESQEPNGHVPPINPAANWGFTKQNGMPPDWSDPWWGGVILEMPWFIYNYYGDAEVLSKSYEPMKRFVDYLGTTTVDSVFIDWWLGDWLEVGSKGRPTRTPIIQTSTTGYFYYSTLLAKIAVILGKNEDSKKYNQLAERIKKAYNKRFLNNETGLYADDSQTAQIMPLYLNLAPEEKKELILERLLENIEKKDGHLSSGFVGYLYLLNGLTEFGYPEVAYKMATKEDYPGWGYMVKDGNTLWESWNGIAFNFASLGGIDSWYYKVLGGINPAENDPGFKKIVINPRIVGDLTWVKASYNSQYGEIQSSWKIEGDSLFMDVVIPVNTIATVYVPARDAAMVTESGVAVSKAKGLKLLSMESNTALYAVGSGTYRFQSTISETVK